MARSEAAWMGVDGLGIEVFGLCDGGGINGKTCLVLVVAGHGGQPVSEDGRVYCVCCLGEAVDKLKNTGP